MIRGEWGALELAASGPDVADNHLNLAVSSEGVLYAAVKTSLGQGRGAGSRIALLVRDSDGAWHDLYGLEKSDTHFTRPIVLRNESLQEVMVAYSTVGGSAIHCRRSKMHRGRSDFSIKFGKRALLLESGHMISHLTSTKQNWMGGVVLMGTSSRSHITQSFTVGSE